MQCPRFYTGPSNFHKVTKRQATLFLVELLLWVWLAQVLGKQDSFKTNTQFLWVLTVS